MIRRRQLFGLTAAGASSLWLGSRAEACSISPSNRTPFSDRNCRRALAEFVRFLNEAPSLTDDALAARADELSVSLEWEWVAETLGDRSQAADSEYTFLREFRLSGGRLDPEPIKLVAINLIRRLGNKSTYQFTLERFSYYPADPEGCNGLFTHDEYYGVDRTAYLATFSANYLKTIRRFPEWYLEPPLF